MALNFPDSPTLNQIYTDSTSGFSYQWNGTVWISYDVSSPKNVREVDDISASFNGTQTQFALTSGGSSISPLSPNQLLVGLGGVVQNPTDDYYISGSNIIFTTAPTSGLSFTGTLLGDTVPLSNLTDGSVTPAKLSIGGFKWDTDGDVTITGVGTTALLVNGNARVTGILTVGSSSIVFDGINDRINVGSGVTIGSGNITITGVITSNTATLGVTQINSTDLNITGILTATSFIGSASGIVGSGSSVSDDTTTNATYYPILSSQSTSGITSYTTSSTKLSFNPSSGVLNATGFAGAGTSVTTLNASNFSTGTVPTARLASGSASASTYLRGDQTWATLSSGITISNDNSTNSTFYSTLTTATSGSISAQTVSSSKLSFNPSSGTLTATAPTASSDLRPPSGASSARPTPAAGSIRWNTDYNTLEYYTGSEWQGFTLGDAVVDPSAATGVFGGGMTHPALVLQNYMDVVIISSSGNASGFGNLTASRNDLAACSSGTRGIFAGGRSPGVTNIMDYITFANTGNATDFGDLTAARGLSTSGCSSSTRGLFGGGMAPSISNIIDYITIASTGDATDFGDLTTARGALTACASSTRGLFGGGYTPTLQNVIDYITIASVGNATDFGDLTVACQQRTACSSSTRGIFAGGFPTTNTIDYVTIASTGNATDFGDLTRQAFEMAGCSNITRGVFGGGRPSSLNVIDYITISSTGNAIDFGDLVISRGALASCSNGHGGLVS